MKATTNGAMNLIGIFARTRSQAANRVYAGLATRRALTDHSCARHRGARAECPKTCECVYDFIAQPVRPVGLARHLGRLVGHRQGYASPRSAASDDAILHMRKPHYAA